MIRSIFALAPLVVLGACISLLPKPPPAPRLYVLDAGDVQRVEGAPIDVVIAVDDPSGARTILGSDIVWRTGDQRAYVAQSQWSGTAEDDLQALVTQTLNRQGRFRAVVRSGGARADYEVRWDVSSFEVMETNGASSARFEADVRIVDGARQVLGAQTITTTAPVGDRSSSVAAQALARAAREGGARIGAFAAETVARAEAERAAAQATTGAPAPQSRAASIRR